MCIEIEKMENTKKKKLKESHLKFIVLEVKKFIIIFLSYEIRSVFYGLESDVFFFRKNQVIQIMWRMLIMQPTTMKKRIMKLLLVQASELRSTFLSINGLYLISMFVPNRFNYDFFKFPGLKNSLFFFIILCNFFNY